MTEDQVWTFIEAWKQQDIETLMAFISDDCVYTTTTGPAPGTVYQGKNAVREGFLRVLAEGAEEQAEEHYGPLCLFEDRGLLEWAITSTDGQGKRVTMRGCDLLEFAGGKICRKDAFRKVFG